MPTVQNAVASTIKTVRKWMKEVNTDIGYKIKLDEKKERKKKDINFSSVVISRSPC